MSSIQSLLESANPWKSLQSDAAKLASKWSKTGLLEGFGSEVERNNMALILENQAKQLVVEANSTGAGSNAGTFNVGQSENWAGIALPLVRKVFGQIAAKEFVSVQPMNLPSGLVFFLDFQYGNTKNPFATNESLYGNRNANDPRFPFATTDATKGLYGAGRFTYSTNQTSSTTGNIAAGTTLGASTVTSASWANLYFDSDYSASCASTTNAIKAVTIPTSSIPDFDIDGIRGFIITSGSTDNIVTPAQNLQQFTQLDLANGNITFFISSSNVANLTGGNSVFKVYYQKRTYDYNRGDFEDTTAQSYSVPNAANTASISIPEINIKMQSQAIVAKTKKLKAVWTPEFAQDLNAYQNIDAEAELTNIMSEYISMEIDLEILDMLIEDAAAGTEYWSVVNNQAIIGGTSPSVSTTSLGFYNTQGAWFQTLGTKKFAPPRRVNW